MRVRLRTLVRVAVGVISGATIGLVIALFVANIISTRDGTSVAWAKGLVVMYFAGLPALILGGVVGGVLARRFAARPVELPWEAPPAGTWIGHYPLALVGGTIIGVASSIIILPMASIILELFAIFLGMLFPRLQSAMGFAVVLTVLGGMVAAGRWATRMLDRRIHRSRMRTA